MKKLVVSHGNIKLSYQLLRKMKLTILLLFASALSCISAETYSQITKLNVVENNSTLLNVIRTIENQSEFNFFYNEKVDIDKTVSVDMTDKTVNEILDKVLANSTVKYKVIGRQIALYDMNEMEPFLSMADQDRSISGKVTDENGNPLPGVTVLVKGTTLGTLTDVTGKYAIDNVPQNATLIFSFVGMTTQEISIGTKTQIDVTMAESAIGLEEVVVVGYGTQKKVNLTGAVSQVGSEVLQNRAISNVGEGLQGIIPNLNISISDGSPKTNPSFNIRGGTSFSGNNFIKGSPLVLVDGVEMDINSLNTEDIESISVLKDASSAAIYGARAAYGVMLVTTKHGRKSTDIKISYNGSYQFSRPVAIPDLLDNYTSQLASIEAKKLVGLSASESELNRLQWTKEYMDNPETAPIYHTIGNRIIWVGNMDIYDEAIRNWTPAYKNTINISGGTEKISYFASIGYMREEGLYKVSTDINNRYNALLNLSSDITNRFTIDYKLSFNNSDYTEPYNNPGKGGWWYAMAQQAEYNLSMPLKTPKDSPVPNIYTDNILAYMAYGSENSSKKGTYLMSIAPTFKIVKGLNLKGDFTFSSYNSRLKLAVPELVNIASTWTPVISPHTYPSFVSREQTDGNSYTLNVYGDYIKTFAKNHIIHALIGFNQEWMKSNNIWSKGTNLLTASLPVISQTLGAKTTGDSESHWAIRGLFLRFNYNFNEKYLLELNGRYDGTSRFPTNSRFKFFPSLSAAWRISEENFAQRIKEIVTNLKIRMSYGSLGNQSVADYLYLPSYSSISQVNYVFGSIRPMGMLPPSLVSASLTWEQASTIDFGIDFSLINKFDFSFDWYNRTTSDILVSGDKLPAVLGASPPTKNSGEMKTVGWEITAKWIDKLKNGLNYDISLVLSDYQSEITKFYGNPYNVLSSLYVGQKMGEIWGYETMNLFQSLDEIQAAPSQQKVTPGIWYPGDVRYKNLNEDNEISSGSNTLDDPGDRKIIGNSTPRYQYGIGLNSTWKNFDINLFFQGVGKRDFWTNDYIYWGQITGGLGTWNSYQNSWTEDNIDAFFPGYRNFKGNTQIQTRYLQNAAYLRLKSLTFGYALPNKITDKIKIEKLRIYFNGQNLWEKTKVIDSIDPELMTGIYPMMRSYLVGLQITL